MPYTILLIYFQRIIRCNYNNNKIILRYIYKYIYIYILLLILYYNYAVNLLHFILER
jgi:hypothetical protein